MQLRGLPRHDAEREAFQHLTVEYLNETHPNTDPTRCGHCGGPETSDGSRCRSDGRSPRMAALRLFGAMADPATAQGRRRSRSPGRCEVGAMTGVKIRDSERWKHRRKPAPVEDAAPAPAADAAQAPSRRGPKGC
jgi:hypothetical protein